MNYSEVQIRMEKVVNSCTNIIQIVHARIYCIKLINNLNFKYSDHIKLRDFFKLIYSRKKAILKRRIMK